MCPKVGCTSIPVDCSLSILLAVQNRDADLRQTISPDQSYLLRTEGLVYHFSEIGLGLYNYKVNHEREGPDPGRG